MVATLHPKSFSTASLFTTTALLAFLVVGAPHILPCPAPHHHHADAGVRRQKRACPIPRPQSGGGLVAEVLSGGAHMQVKAGQEKEKENVKVRVTPPPLLRVVIESGSRNRTGRDDV